MLLKQFKAHASTNALDDDEYSLDADVLALVNEVRAQNARAASSQSEDRMLAEDWSV